MRRKDRMATVLRVRELVEHQRQADRAHAAGEVARASAARHDALAARAEAGASVGDAVTPAQLASVRSGAIALEDLVRHTTGEQRVAERKLTGAERRLTEAAIARRSAERLQERRELAEAREVQRVEDRRADDVGLQQWRSQR